jgi:hypothetical protein
MAYQTPSALPSQYTASILNLNVIKPSALRCASKICTERGYAHTPMSTRIKEASDNRQRGEILNFRYQHEPVTSLFFTLVLVPTAPRQTPKKNEQVMVSTPLVHGNGNEGAKTQ